MDPQKVIESAAAAGGVAINAGREIHRNPNSRWTIVLLLTYIVLAAVNLAVVTWMFPRVVAAASKADVEEAVKEHGDHPHEGAVRRQELTAVSKALDELKRTTEKARDETRAQMIRNQDLLTRQLDLIRSELSQLRIKKGG